MSYFKRFPLVQTTIEDRRVLGVNLTRRVTIPEDIRNNPNMYVMYNVREGETPEMLADRVYKDIDLTWVILAMNQVYDINEHWPLSQIALNRYMARKYDDVDAIHHYEAVSSGAIVDSDWPQHDIHPVTNREHENRINDSKREIKMILPRYLTEVGTLLRDNLRPRN